MSALPGVKPFSYTKEMLGYVVTVLFIRPFLYIFIKQVVFFCSGTEGQEIQVLIKVCDVLHHRIRPFRLCSTIESLFIACF